MDPMIVELDDDLYLNLRDVQEAERFPDRLRVVMRQGTGRDLTGARAERLSRWLKAIAMREPDEAAFSNPVDTTPRPAANHTAPAGSK